MRGHLQLLSWLAFLVLAAVASIGMWHPPQAWSSAAPHPRTGGVTYALSWLRYAQRQADRGNRRYLFYRNPVRVTLHDLRHYGYTGAPIRLVAPPRPVPAPTAHHGEDGQPETDVIVRFRGRRYWVVLNQFVRYGPGGIWVIITITPM